MPVAGQRVTVSVADGIARVRLNRPDKRNALDLAMFEGIAAAQQRLKRDRSVQAVIVDAAGEDFSSGLDVKAVLGDRRAARKLLWKWWPWQANLAQRVSVGWRHLKVPVIAGIRGRCWGGGLQIALGADFRFAHPESSLSVMEARWGIIPDMGGTLALRELLPADQAMRLAMTAETFDGATALELGLVTGVDSDPEAAALNLAQRLLERSPDTNAAIKRLYRKSWNLRAGSVLARESAYQFRILARPNQRIAVKRQRGENIPWRRD
ncbi:crotonase/enoyl-CoA hydratase family protein [Elongatibacter sediminis]|uniref:Crotonase/enoyl-CoA hydratase family protein n=1 Tax=Elongatibacter sediminis TaxID=3119006 RepID=A0AAW9RG82_9GAMM